jgi:serine/threonine-protein kinase
MAPLRRVVNPGDLIDGKYVVERLLGVGGMGLVVAARDRIHGFPVAIKLLRPGNDEISTRRFLREARGASQLRNEHVARVLDVGMNTPDQPYIAMELLEGPDLATVRDHGPLQPQVAAAYIMQACAGLAEAHELGMVHRDIKPANLMLGRAASGDWIVKVLDFGIATAAHNDLDTQSLTQTNTVVGSIGYMSPEQLRSKRDVGPCSDVWGLGVVLYELLSGRVPFPGNTYAWVAIAIATEPHKPLIEAEPALAAVVDRCLAKKPADRYASVWELADALAPFANLAPVVRTNAAGAATTQKLRKRATRARALWSVALVTVAAIVSFTAVTVAESKPSSALVELPSAPVASKITVEPIIEPAAPSSAPAIAAHQVAVQPGAKQPVASQPASLPSVSESGTSTSQPASPPAASQSGTSQPSASQPSVSQPSVSQPMRSTAKSILRPARKVAKARKTSRVPSAAIAPTGAPIVGEPVQKACKGTDSLCGL